MMIEYEDASLDRLEVDPDFDAGLPQAIVRSFRKCINMIRNAPDEQVFRQSKGLHYEKLIGDREGQRSMRLNKQYRLILRIVANSNEKIVVVISIEDYH